MQTHLETLRTNIAQRERLHRESKNRIKRDIFWRLTTHYKALAEELEQAIAEVQSEKV